jgi:hypothetical protein
VNSLGDSPSAARGLAYELAGFVNACHEQKLRDLHFEHYKALAHAYAVCVTHDRLDVPSQR